MKKTLILLILLLFTASLAFSQSTRPFTFFTDPATLSVPVSTTITIPLCFSYTGGLLGSYQSIAPDSYIVFRFDSGFGTLNSVSNLRLVDWARGTTPSSPVAIEDFSATIPLPTSTNKIIIEYEGESTKTLAYRRQLCVDASWTSPSTPGSGVIEFNESIIDLSHPTTYELVIFVH